MHWTCDLDHKGSSPESLRKVHLNSTSVGKQLRTGIQTGNSYTYQLLSWTVNLKRVFQSFGLVFCLSFFPVADVKEKGFILPHSIKVQWVWLGRELRPRDLEAADHNGF